MPRSSSEGAAVREGGIRKKMRKGTHSCFECRRRKIRCIYNDEHPSECTECFARGSRCVDQEHADPEQIVDNRKNLRERVAKLEALVESLLDDKTATGAAETLRKLGADVLPPTPRSDASSTTNPHQAPLMAVFANEAIIRSDQPQKPTNAPAPPTQGVLPKPPSPAPACMPAAKVYDFPNFQLTCECEDIGVPKVKKSKEKRTRDALLQLLPSKETTEEAVTTNDDWWRVWRHKIAGTARGMELKQFATHALSDQGSPAELGVLLLCIGVALDLDDLNSSLAVVDALIISDDEYACSLTGLECCVLVSKCYSDIGQPRRAWLAARKGLNYAQLMGLHRTHASNPVWDGIWWHLYQSDRFLSLLLGLPYGIADSHCDMNFPRGDKDTDFQRTFMLQISVLGGKVIDRTQGVQELSLAAALELDQELDTIVAAMPEGWWETQSAILGCIDPLQMSVLRERLLAQIAFQQLRVYLHLPFMLKSTTTAGNSSKFEYSRKSCFSAARELLRLYHFLRSGNGEPLYECKVIDFLAFTSAVLLMLGLLGFGRLGSENPASYSDSVQEEQDWRLLEISRDIFARASTEKGGKVASQSLKVLEQLASVKDRDGPGIASQSLKAWDQLASVQAQDPAANSEDAECNQRIVIPYFGTISVRKPKKFSTKKGHGAAAPSNHPGGVSSSSASTAAPHQQVAPNAGSSDPNSASQAFQQPYFSTPVQTTPNQHSNSSSIDEHGVYSPSSTNTNNPYIAYDPFLFPTSLESQPQGAWGFGEDGIDNLMSSGGGPWHSLANMDIDQDWMWFMGNGAAQPPGGV